MYPVALGFKRARNLALSGLLATTSLAAQDNLDFLDAPIVEEPTDSEPVETISLPEPSPSPAPPPPRVLEEVIVTAQRKEERLQDAPISIAAFNNEQLASAGITGLDDIGSKVPALQIEPFPTSNATLRFYIRGIGIIDAQITQDPAIGVYIDGVYIARSTGTAFELADLERIEILRGPQGTLYGRNTTGGAINLITRRPDTATMSFGQSVTLSNRDGLRSKAHFNLPLTDTLAAKLAVLGERRDGYVENRGPGGDYGDRESRSARLDLRWLPADDWTADYSFDFSDTRFFNYQYQAVLTPESDKGQAEPIKREAQAESLFSNRRLDTLATGMPLEESSTEISGHAITLQRAFADFDLKYIGAFRELREAFYTDLGGGAGSTEYRLDTHSYTGPAADQAAGGPTPLIIPVIDQQQQSHELQWLGTLFDPAIDFVAGLFYFQEQAEEVWNPLAHQLSARINPGAEGGAGDLTGPAAPRLVSFINLRNEIDNEALALYGQATWTPDLWEQRLDLTLGYRHSRDRRFARKTKRSPSFAEYSVNGEGLATEVASPIDLPPGPLRDALAANSAFFATDEFDRVPGRVSYSDNAFSLIGAWRFNPNHKAYAKYVEAYKSGGFNTRDPQIDGDSGPAPDGQDYGFGFAEGFAPEQVQSVELGWKSEWFDRRLRVNADVFATFYEDMQINFLLAGTVSDTKTANAGEARMVGLEVDADFVAHPRLAGRLSYAFLDAKIQEVRDLITGENVANRFQFNSAPPHSAALNLDWLAWQADWGELSAILSYQFVDARQGGVNVGRPVTLRAHQLMDLRADIRPYHGFDLSDLSVGLWVRNVLDEVYEISAIDNLPHADRAVLWGEPRSFGLDLQLAF